MQKSPEAAAQAAELAPALLKVLADGLSKPVMRSDGLAALLALTLISAADSGARDGIVKDKVRAERGGPMPWGWSSRVYG